MAAAGGKRTFEECSGHVGFARYGDVANVYLHQLLDAGRCFILAL